MGNTAPDIVVLGLQEVHPVHVSHLRAAAAAALDDALPSQRFVGRWHEALNSYTPLLLFERVRDDEDLPSSTIAWDSLEFSFDGNKVCSKGCVAATWSRNSVELCIVNAHLEAGHGKLAMRNEMQSKIEARFETGPTQLLVEVGDLNYRLKATGNIVEPTKKEPDGTPEFNLEFETLVQCCEAGDAAALTSRCQLLGSKASGAVFVGFEEADLSFHPTYKREPTTPTSPAEDPQDPRTGAPRYDRHDRRLPGWCDRVLWRSGSELSVSASHYAAVESATYSDHRPVHAVLRVSSACSDSPPTDAPTS